MCCGLRGFMSGRVVVRGGSLKPAAAAILASTGGSVGGGVGGAGGGGGGGSLADAESRCAVLQHEIDDRHRFLDALRSVGNEAKYEARILAEVTERQHEMARLRVGFAPSKLSSLPLFEYNLTKHVAQYGDDLFRCPTTGRTFFQLGHLVAHTRDFARNEVQAAEKARVDSLVPRGLDNTYEVYGNRYGVNAVALEEARARQAVLTSRLKEEQGRRLAVVTAQRAQQRHAAGVAKVRAAEARHDALGKAGAAAASWGEARRVATESRQLCDELHERMETQDFRAKMWEAEKAAAAAAAAEEEAAAARARRAEDAAAWKAAAAEKERAVLERRRAEAERRAALDAETWKDELKDLRRGMKHLDAVWSRKARDKAKLAEVARLDREREARARAAMAAREAEQREFEARVPPPRPPHRHRRKKKRAAESEASDGDGMARRMAEQARLRRLDDALKRVMALADAQVGAGERCAVARAWDRWQDLVRWHKLRTVLHAWEAAARRRMVAHAWAVWWRLVRCLREWDRRQMAARLAALRAQQEAYMGHFRAACLGDGLGLGGGGGGGGGGAGGAGGGGGGGGGGGAPNPNRVVNFKWKKDVPALVTAGGSAGGGAGGGALLVKKKKKTARRRGADGGAGSSDTRRYGGISLPWD